MTLEEKILNMRMNEFGLSKQSFAGSKKDTFPMAIDVVMWEKTEPQKVFSVELNDYVLSTNYCFVLGTLEWNKKEKSWYFKSVGTRYFRYATDELNEWLLKFCTKYSVSEDGEIYEQ